MEPRVFSHSVVPFKWSPVRLLGVAYTRLFSHEAEATVKGSLLSAVFPIDEFSVKVLISSG